MLPKRLKDARTQAGLTQEKLGVMAGIDETTARSRISQYEIGIHRPSFEMICTIAQVLNIPEGYFYTLDDKFAMDIIKLYRQKQNSK